MNIDNLLKQLGLFWQYPVITEKEFYRQNKEDVNYIPFPWATIIDKNVNLNQLLPILKQAFPSNKQYYTCCQHIRYRELKQLWNELGIATVYTSHKCLNEDTLGSIKLIACPLYAVNLEDETRNNVFKDIDLLKKKRKYFYSFAGGYQANCYLTDIRLKIFNLNKKSRNDCIIRNTGIWHFNCDVYGSGQDINGNLNEDHGHKIKTEFYNSILLDSRYILAPSGSGPNSIRFWEALGAGAIPVLLADTLELPKHELWEKSIVRIKECELENIDDILGEINEEEERERRENCLKLYEYFRNNYKNIIQDTIALDIHVNYIGSYYNVFGHFYLDHLFILYKIKCWLEETKNIKIKNIYVPNQDKLASFIIPFYEMLFEKVLVKPVDNMIQLGTIIGSIKGTETNKIYLDRSEIPFNIPNDVMTNGRKLTDLNRKRAKEIREIIWKHCDIQTVDRKSSKEILIVDRKQSPRKLINTQELLTLLENKNYTHRVILMENFTLKEQIRLSYSYDNILMPCGSGYTHMAFIKENSNYFELCAPGFRYPNPLIFGNVYNINTKLLMLPLNNIMPNYRNLNIHTQHLFKAIDNNPPVSSNTEEDISRESDLYNLLLSPNCIKCFDMHGILDVNCIDHLVQLKKLL